MPAQKRHLQVDYDHLAKLRAASHATPHNYLGAHLADHGAVVRAYHPEAKGCDLMLTDGSRVHMQGRDGLFIAEVPALPHAYKLQWKFSDGGTCVTDDPYRFLPTFGEVDQHLFNEGRHHKLWKVLGAHPMHHQETQGTAFAVWAPNARRVSVVGDFCGWDGRRLPMRSLGASGVFELFVPDVHPGTLYKYEILGQDGGTFLKTDPMAQAMQLPPETATCITQTYHQWHDGVYMQHRAHKDWRRSPLAIYEVHAGSWARVPEEGGRPLTYRELASSLIPHVKKLGFNAIELLPVSEHPFTGSWGYQVSGYYAPTSRYGSPDDLRFFIDACHAQDVAVILDWVPAHFPKDAFALARFDGTCLYEHDDPRRGEHPDWGTLIFNYGRNEVRNFLVANALYWFEEFHIDGLRVDAVASMLYLDYSRQGDDWLPNVHGGRENLEALGFLRDLNEAVRQSHPDCMMIAEESTAWPGVTSPVDKGGLGFTFKWNMGWMHDTLKYFQEDPVNRKYHQDAIKFSMIYEYTERFIMPISHDEVVHGKGSLLQKMPGDMWQKFANLRLLYAYMYLRPGKKLLFMGCELGTMREWNHDISLDWHLENEPERRGLAALLRDLGTLYQGNAALWQIDCDPQGFSWIDHQDHEQSVLSFARQGGDKALVVLLNFTPVPRPNYRVGLPEAGVYTTVLNTDHTQYGGSHYNQSLDYPTENIPFHGQQHSALFALPPLGALVLEHKAAKK